ncbi:MAG: hypothetical protein WDN30_01805 [Pararobbsia sp.]
MFAQASAPVTSSVFTHSVTDDSGAQAGEIKRQLEIHHPATRRAGCRERTGRGPQSAPQRRRPPWPRHGRRRRIERIGGTGGSSGNATAAAQPAPMPIAPLSPPNAP